MKTNKREKERSRLKAMIKDYRIRKKLQEACDLKSSAGGGLDAKCQS